MMRCHHDKCEVPVYKLIHASVSNVVKVSDKSWSIDISDSGPVKKTALRTFNVICFAFCKKHLSDHWNKTKSPYKEWSGILVPPIYGVPECDHPKCGYSSTKYYQRLWSHNFCDMKKNSSNLISLCEFHVSYYGAMHSYDEISRIDFNQKTIEGVIDQ